MRRLWYLSEDIVPDGHNVGRRIIDVIEDAIEDYKKTLSPLERQTLSPALYPTASQIVGYWLGLESASPSGLGRDTKGSDEHVRTRTSERQSEKAKPRKKGSRRTKRTEKSARSST